MRVRCLKDDTVREGRPNASSVWHTVRGGCAEPSPLRPCVARHQLRFRRCADVRTASAFLHTPRGRRNYRPRRGERRYCPANFDVDISATLSLISFFPIVFFVFLGIIRPKQILIPSRTFFPVLPTSRWGRYFSPQQLRCSFTEDKDRHTYQTDPRFERRSMGLV